MFEKFIGFEPRKLLIEDVTKFFYSYPAEPFFYLYSIDDCIVA